MDCPNAMVPIFLKSHTSTELSCGLAKSHGAPFSNKAENIGFGRNKNTALAGGNWHRSSYIFHLSQYTEIMSLLFHNHVGSLFF